MITLDLPWPPSCNANWERTARGMKRSDESNAYRTSVLAIVQQADIKTILGRVALTIRAFPPDARRHDLDNLCKVVNDSLQAARVFKDDEQIDDLRIMRRSIETPGRLLIEIEETAPPPAPKETKKAEPAKGGSKPCPWKVHYPVRA